MLVGGRLGVYFVHCGLWVDGDKWHPVHHCAHEDLPSLVGFHCMKRTGTGMGKGRGHRSGDL